MFTRYASAATSSAFMTFGLLFVMQLLISLQPAAEVEARERHNLSFTRLIIDTPPKLISPIPPIEELTKTMLPPVRPIESSAIGPILVRMTPPPAPPIDPGMTGPGFYNDGPLVAMVRVRPVYPARPLAQGLEGTVLVQFDVSAQGQVVNVSVVESSSSQFERSSIQAAERFKFKPRVVDGVAYATYGIQNLFRFTLDDL